MCSKGGTDEIPFANIVRKKFTIAKYLLHDSEPVALLLSVDTVSSFLRLWSGYKKSFSPHV
jgi:hypothetical protein